MFPYHIPVTCIGKKASDEDDTQENIDTRYNAASIKADVTNTSHTVGTRELQNMTSYGNVKAWLEDDTNNSGKYILYVGSDGPTYLSTGNSLFADFQRFFSI